MKNFIFEVSKTIDNLDGLVNSIIDFLRKVFKMMINLTGPWPIAPWPIRSSLSNEGPMSSQKLKLVFENLFQRCVSYKIDMLHMTCVTTCTV